MVASGCGGGGGGSDDAGHGGSDGGAQDGSTPRDGSVRDGDVPDGAARDGDLLADGHVLADGATADSSTAGDAGGTDGGSTPDAGGSSDAGMGGSDGGAAGDAGVTDAGVTDAGPLVCYDATFSNTGRVEAPTSPLFNPAGSFTLEAWIAPATVTSGLSRRVIAAHYGRAQDQNLAYRIALDSNGQLVATASRFGASSADYLHPTVLTAGTFHHVAMVVDTTAQTLTMYVDGVPGQAWFAGLSAINATTQPFTIGDYDASLTALASSPFSGVISDVRLSNGTRYTATFTPAVRLAADAMTVALYPLDEAPGVSVRRDISGNGLHASVTSADVTATPAASCR